jgi:hypothetical protein
VDERTWERFAELVEGLVNGTAAGKGYNGTGPNGPNDLYEFVAKLNEGPGHALGEMIYKIVRYKARRNPEDLLKVAAWAFLAWKHRPADQG